MPRSTSSHTSSRQRVSDAGRTPVAEVRSSTAIPSSHIEWKNFVDEELKATLHTLRQLNAYAKQKRVRLDSFAVSINDFRLWGHSEMQLRILVMEGVLIHIKETTVGLSRSRKFENGGTNAFEKSSCFLLSESQDETIGGLLARDGYEGKRPSSAPSIDLDSTSPFWDPRHRKLMYSGKLVKHFRCPAHNQETILSAFQEEEWPPRISDPLPPSNASDSKQRLHDTIRSLNRNQANSLIKFGGDGTGEGVVWEVQKSYTRLPTA